MSTRASIDYFEIEEDAYLSPYQTSHSNDTVSSTHSNSEAVARKDTEGEDDRMMLLTTLLGQMTCGTQYYNIVAFFPLFVENNYVGLIDSTMVAICLSAF